MTKNTYINWLLMISLFIYKINGKSSKWMAAFSTVLLVSLLYSLNFIFLLSLFSVEVTRWFLYILFFCIFLYHYIILIIKKRFLNIYIQNVSHKPVFKIASIFLLLLLFFSLILFIILE